MVIAAIMVIVVPVIVVGWMVVKGLVGLKLVVRDACMIGVVSVVVKIHGVARGEVSKTWVLHKKQIGRTKKE